MLWLTELSALSSYYSDFLLIDIMNVFSLIERIKK